MANRESGEDSFLHSVQGRGSCKLLLPKCVLKVCDIYNKYSDPWMGTETLNLDVFDQLFLTPPQKSIISVSEVQKLRIWIRGWHSPHPSSTPLQSVKKS